MRKLLLVLTLLSTVSSIRSQTFDWVQSEPIKYTLNPSYPEFPVAYDSIGLRVLTGRVDSVAQIYGQAIYGPCFIESRDTAGQLIWQIAVGDMASINRVVTDLNGNIYFGGSFQNTLHIGANDTLAFINNTVSGFNTYIVKMDSQGNVIWMKNLASTWVNYERIEAMAVSPSNVCWYAITDFFDAHVISLDAFGNDQTDHHIMNGKTLGNISFDPWGGMFISGGAENGNFIMDADTFQVPHQYNMFIARYNPQGQPSWAKFAADITFQRPVVVADNNGSAFFFGTRYDTTSFDNLFFTTPLPFGDFFGFKTDTSGTMYWKLQQPPLLIGPFGGFEPASNVSVGSDAQGNYYLAGIHHGTVDWGNGLVTSTSAFNDRKISVACINSAGIAQWVKMGGSNLSNFTHAIAVSNAGDCYFTGNFMDSASFDSIVINTQNLNNFCVGKIGPFGFTGMDEIAMADFSLFPNPSQGELNLPESLLGAEMRIYDIAGRIVYEEAKLNQSRLNFKSLSTGMYSVQFKLKDKIINKRWIKN